MDQAQASVACPELFLISLAQTSLAHENEKAQLLSQWALSFSDPEHSKFELFEGRSIDFRGFH